MVVCLCDEQAAVYRFWFCSERRRRHIRVSVRQHSLVIMAAKSDGVLKMNKSDVAFTPLQNSDHSGSIQGLHPSVQADGTGTGDAEFANGESRCCGRGGGGGGSRSACVGLGQEPHQNPVWDCLWILTAMLVYVADVGTDVWLSVDYYLHRDYWWFGLTLVFVVLGSFSVQLFSFRWFVHDFAPEDAAEPADGPHMDGNKLLSGDVSPQHHPVTPQRQASTASRNTNTTSTTSTAMPTRTRKPSTSFSFCVCFSQALIHILQLGQIWRYLNTIYLGIRSRQSAETERWRYYWRMIYEFADVSMLHLLATFLESAPQLVLQLCIIIQTHKLQAVQGMTAAASLVSLAWALASYQKALRESRDDKKPISYLAVIIQFCWHFFTIAARVITFALFASVFQLYFGIFIVLHWCIMTFWIVHCETDFCISKWEEIVFDMVVGIIYIFSWFNVKEGRTRCRLFIYYLVILVENAALSALWYIYRSPHPTDSFAVPALCVIFSSFLTGVVFLLMYYAFFHPNGPRFGHSPSCQRLDLDSAAQFSTLPSEGATNSLRSNLGGATTTLERDCKHSERDGCMPVFQVRHTVPSTPSSRAPRLEETVIKIDLCRNRYPAWERHVLDRSIRKAILAIDCSLTPRLQYKDDAMVQERLEYETTL
ncbi:XK-related protein 4 [Dunckerocampus dactyliophorus]|uniref:XK-related protein 4 n=1 Tax=Dunckerocampus dactyliophorus TaxID=161453 RepID=UPI002405F519|nr:XK-related protein 4 [Dunckerocampus dactyliophorus]